MNGITDADGEGQPSRKTRTLGSPWRYLVSAGALLAAVAHIPVTPEHLEEAPYLGWLFVVFTVASLVLAVAVLVRDVPLVYVIAVGLGAAAIAGYALFRLVPMPQMEGEVGMWYDPYGVLALAGEVILVLVSASALIAARRIRWS